MLPQNLTDTIEGMLANPAVKGIGFYTYEDGTCAAGSQALVVMKPGYRGAYKVPPGEWTLATCSLDATHEDHFDAALTDPEMQTSVRGGVPELLKKLGYMEITYGSLRSTVHDITIYINTDPGSDESSSDDSASDDESLSDDSASDDS